MIKFIKKMTKLAAAVGTALAPLAALAAVANGFLIPNQPTGVTNNLNQIILNITNWVLGFVTILAVLFLIWGGLQYLTAAGNEDQVEKAKNTITYALLGLVVAAIAYAAVVVVVNVFIGGNFT